MSYGTSIVFLLLAALLEAGGDALIRTSIFSTAASKRILFLLLECVVLGAYGYAVNAPCWNFGRLLGVYVALFFLVAQVIALLTFGEKPRLSTILGGVLIVSGGFIVSLGK